MLSDCFAFVDGSYIFISIEVNNLYRLSRCSAILNLIILEFFSRVLDFF